MTTEVLRTRVAHWRVWRGYTQKGLAQATGIPRTTLQRIERGESMKPPPIDVLMNLALVLRCHVLELVDDEWSGWTDFTGRHPAPPEVGHQHAKPGELPPTLPAKRQPPVVARAARAAALAARRQS